MLTLAETAERLNVSRVTVWRLVKAQQIRANRIGRSWRVPDDAVEEYLQRTTTGPSVEEPSE